jgi:hypothetical protein
MDKHLYGYELSKQSFLFIPPQVTYEGLMERPYMKNKESNCHSNKYNIWSPAPKGARHQDELAD